MFLFRIDSPMFLPVLLPRPPRTRNIHHNTPRCAYPPPQTRLLILPGLDGTPLLLTQFLSALPPFLSPVAITYPNIPHTLPSLAAHIAQTYLQRSSPPTILLAQSFSGLPALHLAHSPPDTPPLATIFVNAFPSHPLPAPLSYLPTPPAPLLALRPPPALVAPLFLGTGAQARRDMPVAQEAAATFETEVLRSRVRMCQTADLWHVWRDRGALQGGRTLYLRGGRDRVVREAYVKEMRAARPDVRWERVEDGPHLLVQAKGAECGRAIGAFCEGVLEYNI